VRPLEATKQVQGMWRKQHLCAWKTKALLCRVRWLQYLPSQETQEGLQALQGNRLYPAGCFRSRSRPLPAFHHQTHEFSFRQFQESLSERSAVLIIIHRSQTLPPLPSFQLCLHMLPRASAFIDIYAYTRVRAIDTPHTHNIRTRVNQTLANKLSC
jgi:hypothetical protein